MKWRLGWLMRFLVVASASAEVRGWVQGPNGMAWVRYDGTAGELVRAFALDVSVDRGRILGVSNFRGGPGTPSAPGCGIFPAALRDQISVGSGTAINWAVSDSTALAVKADDPVDTLAGRNSSGVTLEFGGLWNPKAPATMPPAAGVFGAWRLSAGAAVSMKANRSRGGVVAVEPGGVLAPVFTGTLGQPPEIPGLSRTNGIRAVAYAGGELESAVALAGPWAGTGDSDGQDIEPVGNGSRKFFRVRGP